MNIRLAILLCSLIVCLPSVDGKASWYAGAGGFYFSPTGDAAELNDAGPGSSLLFEARHLCQLWYGLRVDYADFARDEAALFDDAFYTDGLYISPSLRYNFVNGKKFSYGLVPYGQLMLTLSSLGNNDQESRNGLGGAAGAGLAYCVPAMNRCLMLDLHLHYSAPNFISRADERPAFQSINLGLNLSIAL